MANNSKVSRSYGYHIFKISLIRTLETLMLLFNSGRNICLNVVDFRHYVRLNMASDRKSFNWLNEGCKSLNGKMYGITDAVYQNESGLLLSQIFYDSLWSS